ncbi:hypothetical protein AcW2_004705 [Taiwanofungus camphoratus]|nr:hypothetical protein AcW2_004705 [Antrodia cinnamomea]
MGVPENTCSNERIDILALATVDGRHRRQTTERVDLAHGGFIHDLSVKGRISHELGEAIRVLTRPSLINVPCVSGKTRSKARTPSQEGFRRIPCMSMRALPPQIR